MGIYDRDYYQDEAGGWWARMAGRQATVGLVCVCGAVALLQLLSVPQGPNPGLDPLTGWGAFSQAAVEGGQVWRLVTPLVLTDLNATYPLWQVILTLLVLYYVGVALESVYGTGEFLAFFLVTGVLLYLGRFLCGLVWPGFSLPVVGSGAVVVAALVLYACHHPHQRWLLFFVIPVPTWAIATVAVVAGSVTQINEVPRYPACLIGAALALAYYHRQVRLVGLWQRLAQRTVRRSAAPHLSIYRGSDEAAERPRRGHAASTDRDPKAHNSRPVDEQIEAQVDAVLEKVSKHGQQSLTPDENRLLVRASEIYKRRREREN